MIEDTSLAELAMSVHYLQQQVEVLQERLAQLHLRGDWSELQPGWSDFQTLEDRLEQLERATVCSHERS